MCHVGDPLGITCRASVQFIRWSILQVNEQGSLEMVTTDADINSRDTNQISQRVVNSATFTFMRSSAQRALPLISTSSIDSINIGLNGTVVRCADVGDPMTSASTTIQIIDISKPIIHFSLVLCINSHYLYNHRSVHSDNECYFRRILCW